MLLLHKRAVRNPQGLRFHLFYFCQEKNKKELAKNRPYRCQETSTDPDLFRVGGRGLTSPGVTRQVGWAGAALELGGQEEKPVPRTGTHLTLAVGQGGR